MAIASEEGRLQQCLNDNINWDLIKPFLEEAKCFSHDELIWHRSKKKRLKSLMKVIADSDKRKLFVQALERTSHDVGHQRILETLDASGEYIYIYIYVYIYIYIYIYNTIACISNVYVLE